MITIVTPPKSLSCPLCGLMMFTLLGGGSVLAEDRLDMSFIQGGSETDAAAWAALNSTYVPGRYLVEVVLNGRELGKQVLDIQPEDAEALCLPDAWLTKTGIHIQPDWFKAGYDASRQCYVLTRGQAVQVEFDVSTQTLTLTLPQQGLLRQSEKADWDYGTSAFRLNYNLNASKGKNNNTAYGSADLRANAGRWILSSTASGSAGDGGSRTAMITMFSASRAIRRWNADLVLGKTQVGDGLLGSTGTYGVTLTHNNSMRPGELGYRPVFSGIAGGYARVTLTQGKNTLYSEMVPPGPFSVTDVALYGSGDVTMTVTEADGRIQTQIFPLSVIAGQLSPGQHEFSLSAGVADDDSNLEGGLMSASWGYGLNGLTLRAGTTLHQQYQGVTSGLAVGLGVLGAVSAEGAWAIRKYEYQPSQSGSKAQLAWSKQLETTGTGVRVSHSRTMTDTFPSLSDFDPNDIWQKNRKTRNIRSEWNAGVSQGVGGLFSLSVSGWQRRYYHDSGKDTGLTGTLSTQVKGVSLNLGVSGSRNTQNEREWAVSASVSVPFTLFEQRYSSNTTVSTSGSGGAGVNTGISGNLNDRLSWGVSGGRDSDGEMSSSLSANYAGERAMVGGNLNQSERGGGSGSFSLNGAVLAVPAARSVMFTRITSDTVAVVGVKDTPGVRVTSGDGQTDGGGNLVVPLNSYDSNTVTIDAGTLPLDTELGQTSRQVVPTGQAVVWMPFDAVKVRRYLLQVRLPDGEFVPGGTWAKDEKGAPLGFVANNGVLMLNVIDIPGAITLGGCTIPAGKLEETEKLQEIRCEKKQGF